jgi:malate synthase
MEDAATAEISRAQVWQWVRHDDGKLEDGTKITFRLVEQLQEEEMRRIRQEVGDENFANGRFEEAAELFTKLVRDDEFVDFLTLPAYDIL